MPLPSNITPVTVTGTYVGDDGTAAIGTVTFTPSKATWLDDAGQAIILPVPVTGTLDASGHFSVQLIPTNQSGISPAGWTYDVVETLDVTIGGKQYPFARSYSILAPSGSAIDISNVAPVAPDGGGANRSVLSVNSKLPDSTGAVTLVPSDIGALPDTYTPPAAPVQSVNGHTGTVALTAADVGAIPITAQVVQSVNGHAVPVVVLTAADVGAVAAHTPQALTDAATIATDASLGAHFRVVLGGNRTLGNPTNSVDGQKVLWEIVQDATGSRTITLGSNFKLGSDIATVILSTAPNARDFLGAVYNSSSGLWYVIAFSKGY